MGVPGGVEPDIAAVHDAATVQAIKAYSRHLESQAHSPLLVPNLARLLGAGGQHVVSGRQTKQELAEEELHTRVAIAKMLNHNYPGASQQRRSRSESRRGAAGRGHGSLHAREHVGVHDRAGSDHAQNLRDRGDQMHDEEYTRRRNRGCTIYLLNYLLCCVLQVQESPEAHNEQCKRAADWHKLERKSQETAGEWETRLVGQSSYRDNEEPLDSNDEKLKLKYILAVRLTGCNDPLAEATFHLRVVEGERVQDKTLKELRVWPTHMISYEARLGQDPQPGAWR